jgi:hypothetical protein
MPTDTNNSIQQFDFTSESASSQLLPFLEYALSVPFQERRKDDTICKALSQLPEGLREIAESAILNHWDDGLFGAGSLDFFQDVSRWFQ